MNQESIIKHYRICKHLLALSLTTFAKSSHPDIMFRMQWNILSTDKCEYNLYYTKSTDKFEIIRIQSHTNIGYKIASSNLTKKSHSHYGTSENYLFGGLAYGLRINGEKETISYVPPDNSPAIVLDPLPIESMRSLLIDNEYEELEFQYGTLHNFENDSFPMYCIYSLLVHVDDIAVRLDDDLYKCVDLLKEIPEEDLKDLELNLGNLLTKLQEDLGYVE